MIKNAIILAAGMGTRLKPLTNSAPKCFTEVNGTPIITNMLKNLEETGIKNCTIVTGYMAEIIKSTLGNKFGGITIEYVHNSIFDKTNDMYSLWLAGKPLTEGAIVLESDIYFGREVLKDSLDKMKNRSYYLGGKYNGKEGEILITVGDKNLIDQLIVLPKGIRGEINEHNYMSAGILVVQKDFGESFYSWMDSSVARGKTDILFDVILSEHIKDRELYLFEIKHSEWVEIDTLDDLKKAEEIFK